MTSQTGLQAARVSPQHVLDRCRELTDPALRTAVHGLHPWPRRMASYALGWCDADGTPQAAGGGKGVRRALAVLGAEAVGAPAAAGVAAAVAVELVHAFSLVHDDIMDGDERRRHRQSTWKAFGTGPAVLAGDALFALAVETLADAEGSGGAAAVRRLTGVLRELMAGQADDLLFETRPWVGPDAVGRSEYEVMAAGKTGSLIGCALTLGPVLAGAPGGAVDALAGAGRHLGAAFQAVDDLLGIWGDPDLTGKPVHADLLRGKKTLPVLAALATDTPAARRLAGLLGPGTPLDPAAARRAARLVEEAGGRDVALAEARRRAAAARACLYGAPLGAAATDELVALCGFLVDRRL
ncbi:polyprenyl synthetase family protein [Streptomyces cinnamoneus]|uniref:Dimethylallyltransferase n=1 Tax=Streptomyces cinnamoneus TaxID=53446 RepID=A0A918WDJ6_STRCJ|nr:polyprenyl synthetase family protein [Streptomyces cinnamoneus]GHC34044.1 dimethylallyltransferase [Streptomyces cinnamoneus]